MTRIEKASRLLNELLATVCAEDCRRCKYDLLCQLMTDLANISMNWWVGEEGEKVLGE